MYSERKIIIDKKPKNVRKRDLTEFIEKNNDKKQKIILFKDSDYNKFWNNILHSNKK